MVTLGTLIEWAMEDRDHHRRHGGRFEHWLDTATDSDMREVLLRMVTDEVEDMKADELRQYVYDLAKNGNPGYDTWTREELRAEIEAQVEDELCELPSSPVEPDTDSGG